MANYWEKKRVLITGGMGFIGSNLAIKLIEQGAFVTIVDAMIPFLGGNEFNLDQIKNSPLLHINISNIHDKESMEHLVKWQDHIFHLASQVSHILGQTDPFPDIDYNIMGTAVLLEACKKNNPTVKILYTGTRGQYGPSTFNPVPEDASLDPLGMHEITKVAAEKIFLEYHKRHKIKCIVTRLTNIYGPRAQMKSDKYCVVNWFIRQALEAETIKLYAGGNYKRDFLFVDDCVDDLLKLAEKDAAYGNIYNVGNTDIASFAEIAHSIVAIVGSGKIENTEFTAERKATEPGDIFLDISKIRRTIDWIPRTTMKDGIKKTVEFYKANKQYYYEAK